MFSFDLIIQWFINFPISCYDCNQFFSVLYGVFIITRWHFINSYPLIFLPSWNSTTINRAIVSRHDENSKKSIKFNKRRNQNRIKNFKTARGDTYITHGRRHFEKSVHVKEWIRVAKIVNKMILNRIQPKLDPFLRPNQNGFRPGRSTSAHISALRRLIEGVKSHEKKAIILFVDFKKAFDSVHRGKMMKIFKAY